MPKLYFRYGTVGSAKTLNLLAVAHNYRQQGKKILLVKPALDTRFGLAVIKTRAGLEMQADVLVQPDGDFRANLDDVVCLLVDEAQFLPPAVIDQFHGIAHACTSSRTCAAPPPTPAARPATEATRAAGWVRCRGQLAQPTAAMGR